MGRHTMTGLSKMENFADGIIVFSHREALMVVLFIFFDHPTIKTVQSALTRTHRQLLESPHWQQPEIPEFAERLHHRLEGNIISDAGKFGEDKGFYMDESYSDSSLTLEDIARQAALNTHHFLRLFKQLFLTTPHQYLTSVRLKNAVRLLEQNSLSVSEVCWDCGFESLASFSLLFKRNFGLSPQAFRLK
jgi:AraC-like DNA-binding protein